MKNCFFYIFSSSRIVISNVPIGQTLSRIIQINASMDEEEGEEEG
jgi:hypothetical protein